MPADKRKPKKASKTVTSSSKVEPTYDRRMIVGICVVIAALVGIVFGQTWHHEFVNFDDVGYVYDNSVIQQGLTASSVAWAFSHTVVSNWHPLTMLTHMADCQFYGVNVGGHHLTNVLLHAATAILLFLMLWRMTSAVWASALVATVFAVHPLRVESVAWISERKDVLSGLFFMLTIVAYVRFARGPRTVGRYMPVVILFALGLMSKSMLVTLPFILLLLDYWPLKRIEMQSGQDESKETGKLNWSKLILEKVPLFLLSAGICVVTVLTQEDARRNGEVIPLSMRLGNAIVSTVVYIKELFYPVKLAAFYPYASDGLPVWQIAVCAIFLLGVTAFCFWQRRQRAYLLVGWLWYLVMLVPVIGLVQVGAQAHADRYTYLPGIGLGIAMVWGIIELTAKWRNQRVVLGVGAAVVIVGLTAMARAQTAYWHDSEVLWRHALACTTDNAVAESNLANCLLQANRLDETIVHARAAVKIKPDFADALNCLGYALLEKGQMAEATTQFQQALKVKPDFVAAHNNLALAFMQNGLPDKAIEEFYAALKLNPNAADSHSNLGVLLMQSQKWAAAVEEYSKAVALSPDFVGANNNLAWLLATCPDASVRNGARAIQLAEHANQLSGSGNLTVVRTLAAAYAEGGRFPEAIQTAEQALQLATTEQRAPWIKEMQAEISRYKVGRPMRDPE